MLTHVDLFSGIGGFALGLKWTGKFKTVLFCEIDAYCQQVLRQHWPNVPIVEDIRDISERTIHDYDLGPIDLVTAGFPCQPFSNAGKRAGASDERYLWPELARAIRALRPRYILLENVPGLLSINRGREFGIVLSDLAACGYDAEWQVIPASAFGAWHRRDRLWIIAVSGSSRWSGGTLHHGERAISMDLKYDPASLHSRWIKRITELGKMGAILPNSPGERLEERHGVFPAGQETDAPIKTHQWWTTEPALGRVAHGVPHRVDRIKAIGNAVVPQVVEWIGEQIIAFEEGGVA